MKKVLVTGSGGFVFSNFIRKALFNKSDYSFVSVDLCKGSNVLNNIYANKGHKFHIGDVTDKHVINVIFELERPDIVIHGADCNVNNSEEVIRTNVYGSQVILEACAKWQVERILYISSDEVYGPLNSISAKEDSPLNPKTIYASTKASSEYLVEAAFQKFGLNYDIVRLGDNYGPRQQVYNFIPNAIRNILNSTEMLVNCRSDQVKEWTYIEDVYFGIMTILEKKSNNQIYNLSSGYEFSYLEVFQEICNIFERGHELIKFVESPSDAGQRYFGDVSKIKALGWKPSFKLKNGLYHTCAWYEKNPWFFRTS